MAVLSLLLAGCSSAPPSDSAGTAPADPKGQSPIAQRALPIDSYLFSFEQFSAFNTATEVLTARCMQRLGFDYVQHAAGAPPVSSRTELRYGSTDLALAQRQGFRVAAGAQTGSATGAAESQNTSAAYSMALTGGSGPQPAGGGAPSAAAGSVGGQEVPPGGCVGEARHAVAGNDTTYGNSDLARKINSDGWNRSKADPRVMAAFRAWSTCMRGQGFSYSDPLAASNDPRFAGSQPTRLEIATAVATVTCSQQANLIDTWYRVDVEYQNVEIAANQLALDELKKANDETLKRAAQVVAAP